MKQLSKRVAVITGAASGIGQALAVALAQEGCALALVDINAEGLAQTAALVEGRALAISTHIVDVSSAAAMAALPEAVIAAHGAVHVVINNAGVTITAPFLEHSLEDLEWIVGINFWGVVYGCRFFLPHLEAVDEAHIVNMSSIFGVIGVPGQSGYCATKFAVRGLSESLWEELSGSHIGLSVVHPGGVNTNIVTSARCSRPELTADLADFFARKAMPPSAAAAQIVAGIKAGRRRVLITREAWALDLLKRLLPAAGNRIATSLLTRAMGLQAQVAAEKSKALL